MTTLYHTTNVHRDESKMSGNSFGLRLLSSKNRNLSISKLNQKGFDI
jgi:hypothetical protein